MENNTKINISGRAIGLKHAPFIIAEMSGNHNQSLERALEIADAASKASVDAIKLQTYTADTLTIAMNKDEFLINDPESLWYGKSFYELYQEAHTPWEWHQPIFDRCKKLGLICFSTPFDETAVDFLESLNVPAYKVASFENNHLPLIRKIAQTGKPMFISTGMASQAELDEAVNTARNSGCNNLILLKCTSSYPASPENTNLLTIPHMRDLFDCQVGLSDHTLGIGCAVASVALGATVIEKHFTLSRADGGVDAVFSLEPAEMKTLVNESKSAWEALGKINYGPSDKEKGSLVFRRSIYIVEDMHEEDVFTRENLKIIRPGFGLSPKHYETILGKKISRDACKGTPFSWELLG
jgi:N-acetylneuraminate synthase